MEGPALTELSLGGQDMAGKGLCSVLGEPQRLEVGLGGFQKPVLLAWSPRRSQLGRSVVVLGSELGRADVQRGQSIRGL